MKPSSFRIKIDDTCLVDLRRRLRDTRWIQDFENADAQFGVSGPLLRRLAEQWADAFDWRAEERKINGFDQFRVTIDGQPVHFLRIASPEVTATPLILTHGWPWTFWDMHPTFAALTNPRAHGGRAEDAFELIVPSLPGFGFSTPATSAGSNFWRTADLWHRLMTESLGFSRYGAAGGDWGAFVSAQLGHKYADSVIAVHLSQVQRLDMFNDDRPWRIGADRHDAPSPGQVRYARRFASHLAVHVIEPHTIAAALHDSPVGMLAWLLQRWCSWGGSPDPAEPALSDTQMLTNATLYWATESLASSLRFYANAAIDPWRPSHDRAPLVEAPTGISLFAGDLPPGTDAQSAAARFRDASRPSQYSVVHVGAHVRGGHFAHFENPAAIVEDIRATFRAARNRARAGTC